MNQNSIPRKKTEKVTIIHHCTKEEQIDKMSLLLLGNGNPKDGYVYKVIEMAGAMDDINEKLTGISGIVRELHEESIGKKAAGKSEKEILAEKREHWAGILKTASFIVAALALCLTAYFSFSNNQKIDTTETSLKKEIRLKEGVSKVTRGGYVKYNYQGLSDSIKLK